MNKLWSIPIIGTYIYTVTILTNYGYVNYFGIPGDFVEHSIKENIIYIFQLFISIRKTLGILDWRIWLFVIIVVLFVWYVFFSSRTMKKIFYCLVICFFIGSLWAFYRLGEIIARDSVSRYVFSSECNNLDEVSSSVIVDFYNTDAIVVSIDEVNNKLKEGFRIEDLSLLDCKVEKKDIGKIIK